MKESKQTGTKAQLSARALQENDGIRSPRFLEGLHNRTRPAGDIGAAVSPDLCLIPNTSERYPFEGTTECPSQRGRDRSLAGSRWTDKPSRDISTVRDYATNAGNLQKNWALDTGYGWRIVHPENQGLLVLGVRGEFLEPDDGEILDESLLDLIETVVVCVQLPSRLGQELAVPEDLERRQMR